MFIVDSEGTISKSPQKIWDEFVTEMIVAGVEINDAIRLFGKVSS